MTIDSGGLTANRAIENSQIPFYILLSCALWLGAVALQAQVHGVIAQLNLTN